MTLWIGLILASASVYSWKIVGALVPSKLLDHPRVAQLVSLITVALMSALIGVQALVADRQVVVDSRLPAALVAIALTVMRLPFIVVVVVSALIAATLRFLLGWP